jgi:RHS repeat-associated protein
MLREGEVRYTSNYTPTKYQYTGQYSYASDFGLLFYNARMYDPVLGRFTSADSLIPGGMQGLDRYAYVNNDPVRYNDPSGHVVCEVGEPCGIGASYVKETSVKQMIANLEDRIKNKFGVKLEYDKVKWNDVNISTAYKALFLFDNILKGKLKAIIGGTTFTMTDGGDDYYGITTSSGVTFHVAGTDTQIPLVNFLHETSHLIDAVPATKDLFSGSLPTKPTWVKDGFVDERILLGNLAQPVQAKYILDANGKQTEAYSRDEYWADAFANYVADNINVKRPAGAAMVTDVVNALNQYHTP